MQKKNSIQLASEMEQYKTGKLTANSWNKTVKSPGGPSEITDTWVNYDSLYIEITTEPIKGRRRIHIGQKLVQGIETETSIKVKY